MSLLVSGGRIQISDVAENKRFDTDDGLFHIISKVSGSVAIAQFTNPDGTNLDSTTSYLLGTCHPDCTDVIGSVKFTLNNNAAGMAFDRWCTVMGGSILWVIDGHGLVGSSPDPNGEISQMVFYSLRVTSGQVYLDRRRLFSKQGQGTYTVLSHTIEYKLKAGLFT